jgi:hypothetical protein
MCVMEIPHVGHTLNLSGGIVGVGVGKSITVVGGSIGVVGIGVGKSIIVVGGTAGGG